MFLFFIVNGSYIKQTYYSVLSTKPPFALVVENSMRAESALIVTKIDISPFLINRL